MPNEVIEFANKIGAKDLKASLADTEFKSLFRMRNYFLLGPGIFLVVKISRSKLKNFWGLGKKYLEIFNKLTNKEGNYFFVGLTSNCSGWVLSKQELHSLISNDTLSFSENQQQYKINDYNLKLHQSFSSIDQFLDMINR